jgi:hypothetical protein
MGRRYILMHDLAFLAPAQQNDLLIRAARKRYER